MSELFDPYVEWLGLRTANRALSYYQLFGLDDFEEDVQRIGTAADAMLARVRSVRPGPQRKRWQELLDELLLAKLCLGDSSRKLQYDRQLSAQRDDGSASRPASGQAIVTVEPPRIDPDLLPPGMAVPARAASPTAMGAQPIAGRGVSAVPPAPVPFAPPVGGPSSLPGVPKFDTHGGSAPLAIPVNQSAPPPAWPGAAPIPTYGMPRSPVAAPIGLTPAESAARPVPAPTTPAASVTPTTGQAPDAGLRGPKPALRPIPLAPRDEAGRGSAPISVGPRIESTRGVISDPAKPSLQVYLAAGMGILTVIVLVLIFSKPAADPQAAPGEPASVVAKSGNPADQAAADEADRRHSQRAETDDETRLADLPAVESAKPPKRSQPKPQPVVIETPPPAEPEKPAVVRVTPAAPEAPAAARIDASKTAAFQKSLATSRGALAERDVPQAKKTLTDAADLAQTPEDLAELGRLKLLANYVDGFWNAVREALKGLLVADELTINGALAAVVESDAESLTVHIGGVNKQYTVRTMPAALALSLAQRWFNQDAGNKLFLGAFQAVDRQGDKNEARRLWEQAAAGGASAEDLMSLSGGGAWSATTAPREVAMPPNEREQAAALKRVKEAFQPDYKSAKTPDRKLELSQKLLNTAAETADPAERYALLREAIDLAATGGSPPTLVQAVEELARWYKIDPLETKADGLARAATATSNPLAAKDIARTALDLLDEAIKAKRARSAGKLSQAAMAAARKSKDTELVKVAAKRNQEVQEIAK